jgi:mRNA interferase RelE/StbE
MTEISIKQMPIFKRIYKKLHATEKTIVDNAIRTIAADPKIAQEKKGDLSGIFVHKFKMNNQQILLAYEWTVKEILLLALGVHENFYRDLKRQK